MTTALRLRALERAKKYVGIKEHPAGSNHGTLIDGWCYVTNGIRGGYPWCLAFVHAMYAAEGKRLGGYGLVEAFDNWAGENGYLVKRPFRGDVICYDWDGDNWDDHVGIVDKVLALRWSPSGRFVGWVRTVEGNTAVGNDSNGGEVMIRYRWIKSARFARIPG